LIGSNAFDASERNRRFLEYVVEETLAGRAERIKAYNVATEVFGRDVNFDPQLDPVVRMEARRLRTSLERYYLTEGKRSELRITLPKGGYVPEFLSSKTMVEPMDPVSCEPGSGPATSSQRVVFIDVLPFEAEGDLTTFFNLGHSFRNQIIVALNRIPEIRVRCVAPGNETPGASAVSDHDKHLTLRGSAALFAGNLNVTALLSHSQTGEVIWGETFRRDFDPRGLLDARDELANRLVRAMTGPNGPLFEMVASIRPPKPDADLVSPLVHLLRPAGELAAS
jgi:adenylate cyclase